MISIRPVNPKEADQCTQIALRAKSTWAYPRHWMETWTPQLTFTAAYFESNESWAAELDGQLTGFYTLIEQDKIAWLENMWVRPEFIGQGIGKALFLHAAGLARQRGYNLLKLEADPNAAGFYKKMGMYKIGERQYEMDGQPRRLPIMEIKL
ncbi:MAG: GNAT family N-acetyltransferase, partial [Bacteroidota bacterium]